MGCEAPSSWCRRLKGAEMHPFSLLEGLPQLVRDPGCPPSPFCVPALALLLFSWVTLGTSLTPSELP